MLHLSRCTLAVISIGACGCVPMRTPDPIVRYIAFGDSTTSGPAEHNYPEVLMTLFAEPENAITAEARGGESTVEGLERLQTTLSLGLFPNATTLLYWQGGVDVIEFIRAYDRLLLLRPDHPDFPFQLEWQRTLDEIQSNVESAIDLSLAANLDVYVATYFSMYEGIIECDPAALDTLFPSQAVNANVYIAMLNDRLRMAAHGVATMVEVAADDAVLLSDRSHYIDCNHLSNRGNEIVAQRFAETLQSIQK